MKTTILFFRVLVLALITAQPGFADSSAPAAPAIPPSDAAPGSSTPASSNGSSNPSVTAVIPPAGPAGSVGPATPPVVAPDDATTQHRHRAGTPWTPKTAPAGAPPKTAVSPQGNISSPKSAVEAVAKIPPVVTSVAPNGSTTPVKSSDGAVQPSIPATGSSGTSQSTTSSAGSNSGPTQATPPSNSTVTQSLTAAANQVSPPNGLPSDLIQQGAAVPSQNQAGLQSCVNALPNLAAADRPSVTDLTLIAAQHNIGERNGSVSATGHCFFYEKIAGQDEMFYWYQGGKWLHVDANTAFASQTVSGKVAPATTTGGEETHNPESSSNTSDPTTPPDAASGAS